MKISAKSAREVLNVANDQWANSLDQHGDAEVDVEAFMHMIAFRLIAAMDEIMDAELLSALTNGLEDAIGPEPAAEPARPQEGRVVH